MQFTRHTLCGPSSLERRALCPGSLAQESWLDRLISDGFKLSAPTPLFPRLELAEVEEG